MEQFVQSRLAAFRIIERVITDKKIPINIFEGIKVYDSLQEQSDKHFCRLLVLTVLRRYRQINKIIDLFLEKPLPEKRLKVRLILCLGIAQILYLETAPYAAVDVSVRLSRLLNQHPFSGFINGVLRNISRHKETIQEPDVLINLPDWLKESWDKFFSEEQIRRFVQTFVTEAPLDITVKENPALWAEKLNGEILFPTGTIRCVAHGNITALEGYETGAWWVQEASASIPAQLFPNLKDLHVADLCAAPGGKTAQLAAQGAYVDAFDISPHRLKRLEENMKRLQLEDRVRARQADVSQLIGTRLYDCVLIDAPCSATGTIRRHPDLLFHRTRKDVLKASDMQKKLLRKAVELTKPGGYIVYSTCSLEYEENEKVVECVLNRLKATVKRVPLPEKWHSFLNGAGAIQVLPDKNQDGFYAVLLEKSVG